MPTLESILELSPNAETYSWVCSVLLKAVVGFNSWNRRYYKETLSDVATASDESFLLLSLENNYDRWKDEWAWNQANKDKEKDERDEKNWAEAKYTNSGRSKSNGRSKRFQGWSRDGYERFNALHQFVLQDRMRRANFEADLKNMLAEQHNKNVAEVLDEEDEDEDDEIFPANDMDVVSPSAVARIQPLRVARLPTKQQINNDENESSESDSTEEENDN